MREVIQELWRNLRALAKWILFAGITGALVGLLGVVFGKCMAAATDFRANHDWVIWFLPAGGMVIIALYHLFKVYNPRGTNLILAAIHAEEEIPLHMAPLISISTVITHLVGGSAGREGAALQLGGSIGNQLGKWFRFDDKDKRVVVMCGMSAAFSALFGTPLAAAIFPMEVVSVGIMHYAALVPCVFASLVAKRIAVFLHMEAEAFAVPEIPEITAANVGWAVLLAVLCGMLSTVFCIMLHKTSGLFKKHFKNAYVQIIAGGILILVMTLSLGTRDYMGAGIPVIERALSGNVRPEAFLLKMILTAVTLGCGFKGGEIVPSLFVGGTFGALFGQMMGLPTALCGACGMAAVFCGVTNCPISTMLISFEMFGFDGMMYYAIVIAVSYMTSGYYGLYHDQRIMYSKVKTEFINRRSQ